MEYRVCALPYSWLCGREMIPLLHTMRLSVEVVVAGIGALLSMLCVRPKLLCGLALLCLASRPVMAETVLRARLYSDLVSSNPGMLRDENTDAVLMHVVEGLVANRENGSVGPMLAESWTKSADGKTYALKLRAGVFFHNGVPLNAADAVWSLKRYFDKKTHWRCYSDLSAIVHVESVAAPDPTTVVMTLNHPAPLFLKTLTRMDCGGTGILQRGSIAADGGWIKPIGTGPFMFGEWKHNQYVDLVRFPRYAALPGPPDGNTGGKHALVDRIRFLVIPDASEALAALESGSIDIQDQLSPTDYAAVKNRRDLKVTMSQTLDMYVLMLQTQDPLLKDVRIRRAIALNIDTAALAKAVTWGTAPGNNSPVPLASPFHDAAQGLRKPDIKAARRLLLEAGYHGQPINLVVNRRNPQHFDVAVLVQAMAAEAGIDFEIEILDWASQFDRYISGDYQAMSFAFSAKTDPTMSFGLLIGDKAKEPRKVWDSPQAIALLKKSAEIEDPAQRSAVFDQLNRAFMNDVPAVAFFSATRISVLRANVVGFKSWPAAQTRLWD